jgi:curved DNA-binding protein CbpA
MEGLLGQSPLAELIGEINASHLWGALRISRGRVKVAVYFEDGALVFASSNLRKHRLRNFLKERLNSASKEMQLPDTATDDEVGALLIQRGILTAPAVDQLRQQQITQVLRLALLWTDGAWSFDPRVRLADNARVEINVSQLLLECARRFPVDLIGSRLSNAQGTFTLAAANGNGELLPEEAFVLSRTDVPVTLAELQATSGLSAEQTLRAIYGLSLAGYVSRSEPRRALARVAAVANRPSKTAPPPAAPATIDEQQDVNALFVRLDHARDHYEVLNVSRTASLEEIKNAYHELALNYHPDRFHQSEPELRARVGSAFARIAQAYETLSDEPLRAAYDKRLSGKAYAPKSEAATTGAASAESAFQKGKAALQQNQRAEALRFFSDAAMQQPRNARYRAAYAQALFEEPNSRRLAESELQAAIALDPGNSSYRIILAELYQRHGLRRRAISELEQVLVMNPANETARTLLAKLTN